MIKQTLFILIFGVLFTACKYSGTTCPEPNAKDILSEAKKIIESETLATVFNPERLKDIDTIEFLSGNFSGEGDEILAVCYSREEYLPCLSFSHLPAPYETASYFLVKLSCLNGKWKVDWASQENKIQKEDLIDIDGDGVFELVFHGNYVCNGGMEYGYYYIVTLKENKEEILYRRLPVNQMAILPNPNFHPKVNDTIVLELEVDFEDVDNNGTMELLEKTKRIIYKGGKTEEEVQGKALIEIESNTYFLKNGKYKMEVSDKQIVQKKSNRKREIVQLMIKFQNYLDDCGFTQAFFLADEVPYFDFYDKKFYEKAIEDKVIDEETDILKYSTEKILQCDLLSEKYKKKVKTNKEKGLGFSFWKEHVTIGAVLTDSEFGLDFRGPLFYGMDTQEEFEICMVDLQRYKNGFSPNPDSIMTSYNTSKEEVYEHFIELSSPDAAAYYVNYKLLRKAGTAPRFIMGFVYSDSTGWLIDDMYFDDYNGKILKKASEYSDD